MVQKVKASYASSGEKDYSRIVSDKGNDREYQNVKLVFSFVKEIRLRSALDLSLQVTEASTKGPSSVSVTAVISLSEVLTQSSRPEELMLKELQHLKLNYFSLSDLGDFMFKSTKSD
ncbi:hypothetical protein Tco_1255740 [Tanacetum coccineum]